MIRTLRCWYCGKRKEWIEPNPEPEWFKKEVDNPWIISLPDGEKRLKIIADFCSEECMENYDK